MSVYHWQELVESTYNYKTTEREVKTFSLSVSPVQFGFFEDTFPFKKYTVPAIICNQVEKLLVKYLGDSSDIQKYLDLGIISQYLFINKNKEDAGKYIDEAKATLQKLKELKDRMSEPNNIKLKNISIQLGIETLKIDSWLFLATYLGGITKTLENLSTGEILSKFEHDKYEDTLDRSVKKSLYQYLERDFVRITGKVYGKYVFIDIFCHIFQVPVGKIYESCTIESNKVFSDYYSDSTDTIKKLLKR